MSFHHAKRVVECVMYISRGHGQSTWDQTSTASPSPPPDEPEEVEPSRLVYSFVSANKISFFQKKMTKRPYDVVVFGATGFTGALVVEYLRDRAPKDLRWAVAGRAKAKLEAVLRDLGVTVPVLIADSGDDVSLATLCQSTNVVVSTVGPFAVYGYPLCAACVRAGTHYCDITGEPQFVTRVIDTLHDDAVRNKALLVNCCGFDSVPSDLGNMMMLKAAAEQFPGAKVKRVSGYHQMKGAASGGTIGTIFTMIETMNRETASIMKNPFAMCPGRRSDVAAPMDIPLVYYSRRLGAFNAPFVMAGINTKVVNRANSLRSSRSQYTERMGPMGLMMALVSTFAFSSMLLLLLPPVRWLAKKFVPKPGEGPSRADRELGWFKVTLVAELDDGRSMRGMVRSRHGDPGYKETAKMLSEAAITIALHYNDLKFRGGVLPPSVALGDLYVDRLVAAGIEFGVTNP